MAEITAEYIKKKADPKILDFLKKLKENPQKNLPEIVEIGTDYYIEKIIHGRTLADIVSESILNMNTARDYMLQLSDAVEFLHKYRVIHRDIKPDNIIIDEDGILKLIDFDIARVKRFEKLSKDTELLGTMGYASPEQYGFSETDERSDIYSMGVVYDFMLTRTIVPSSEATTYAEKIIERCRKIDPDKRYANVQKLRCDIEKERFVETNLLKQILTVIPGFRRGNIVFAFIAIIIYIISFFSIIKMLWSISDSGMDFAEDVFLIIISTFYIFIFFAIATDFLNINRRIKFKWISSTILKKIFLLLTWFLLGSFFMTVLCNCSIWVGICINPITLLLRDIANSLSFLFTSKQLIQIDN